MRFKKIKWRACHYRIFAKCMLLAQVFNHNGIEGNGIAGGKICPPLCHGRVKVHRLSTVTDACACASGVDTSWPLRSIYTNGIIYI